MTGDPLITAEKIIASVLSIVLFVISVRTIILESISRRFKSQLFILSLRNAAVGLIFSCVLIANIFGVTVPLELQYAVIIIALINMVAELVGATRAPGE